MQTLLSEYIDGVLDRETDWGINLHISACAVCARMESELRAAQTLLKTLPEMQPSAGFEEKLAMRLADQSLNRSRGSFMDHLRDWWFNAPYARPAVTSGLAVAAVVPAAIFLFSNRPQFNSADINNQAARSASLRTDSALEQVWAEHASSDPLGDNSSLLLTSASMDASSLDTSAESAQL